jgi:adenylate cyclase
MGIHSVPDFFFVFHYTFNKKNDMKKIVLTIIFLHTISILLSQTARKSYGGESTVKRVKTIKETNGPIIDPNNWEKLVPAAQKVYSKDEAARMFSYGVKQINYLYTNSYKIINNNGCKVNIEEIDFNEVFPKRAQSSVIQSTLKNKDECSFSIEMCSIDELEKEFKKIEKENQ